MYDIKYGEEFTNNLRKLSASRRAEVLDTIVEQLTHQPAQETRNKKILRGLNPSWDHDEPMWELRI